MSKKKLTKEVQKKASFKHLLVPVDFSECSLNAVDFAANLATGTNTIVHLLHVIEFDLNWMGGDGNSGKFTFDGDENSISAQLSDTVEKAQKLIEKLAAKYAKKGIDVRTRVLQGDPIGELLAYEKEQKISLIVMGSHGSRGLNEVLIGSVAQKVNRLASCPVFTIKGKVTGFKFKSMVYCSDFKEENVNKNLIRIKEISEHYKADLTLLFVNTPNKFEETPQTISRIKKVAEKAGLKKYKADISNAYWIEEGIIDYVDANKPSVVAITIHGYRGVKHIFNNNITESLVNHLSAPLLTLNLKK